jgi:hypothetical protein
MFAHLHILQNNIPNFTPDFDNTEYGEYGYREWYDYCVFYGQDVKKEMSYDSMCHNIPFRLALLTFYHRSPRLCITHTYQE